MHDVQVSPPRQLLRDWRLKAKVGIVLTLAYWSGYFFIERHLWRAPIEVYPTAIDKWVPFSPRWVWGYQSIYLMLLPFFFLTRPEIRRFAVGVLLMMLVAFACFIVLPIRGPRPAFVPTSGAYGLLIRCDLPYNNLPSLHMAVATYAACIALHITHGPARRLLMILLPAWVLLIAYSTLATRQHYAIDLLPGILLGWLAQRAAWAGSAPAL